MPKPRKRKGRRRFLRIDENEEKRGSGWHFRGKVDGCACTIVRGGTENANSNESLDRKETTTPRGKI